MNYDTWKTTDPDTDRWGSGHISPRVRFPYSCDGMLSAIRKASEPAKYHVDDVYNEANAVWYAKHVASEAHRLGLVER